MKIKNLWVSEVKQFYEHHELAASVVVQKVNCQTFQYTSAFNDGSHGLGIVWFFRATSKQLLRYFFGRFRTRATELHGSTETVGKKKQINRKCFVLPGTKKEDVSKVIF
jgi:hypothetical protein